MLAVLALAAAQSPVWITDLDTALGQARRSGKPILADIGVGEREPGLPVQLYGHPRVKDRLARFVLVRLDRGDVRVRQELKINTYPTIAFLSPNGKVREVLSGFLRPGYLAAAMDQVDGQLRVRPVLEQRLRLNPNDQEARVRLVPILARGTEGLQALGLMRAVEEAGYRGSALAVAYNSLGDFHGSGSAYGRAIAAYRKGLDSRPQDYERSYALLQIGMMHIQLRQFPESRKWLRQVLEFDRAEEEHRRIAKTMMDAERLPPSLRRPMGYG